MVDTTLRAYLDELNLLLEQEAFEEVIGHCRHILQHFPKNVETYRLLGRALLEKGRHDEAADVFQRVLSALPDDFVAHLGLSGVAEEKGDIPAAIWHIERAYEQDPNNTALQGELQRLYENRDGSAPDRFQLSPAALVRIYTKGRLYDHADDELNAALEANPNRIDLLLLMTDVLWNSDRPLEAGEAALRVLEKLPNSVQANRVMGSLWLKTGRPSEAAPFVARLEQLDPFLTWQTVQMDGTPLPHDAFQLPRLDWDARAAAALATDVPDWVNSISNVFESPEAVPLTGGVSNWLEDAGPVPPMQSTPPTNMVGPAFRAKEAEPLPQVELPDWMGDIATTPPPAPAASSGQPAQGEDVPDWFKDSATGVNEPASAAPSDNALPEWFEEAVAAPAEPAAPAASWMDEEPAEAADEQLPSGFTDLLSSIASKSSTPQPQSSVAPQAVEMPDWMDELAAPAADAPAEADEQPLSSLDEIAPAQSAASGAPVEADEQPLDAMSWLNTGPLPPLDEIAPAQSPPGAPVEADEQPLDAMSWLNTGPLPSLDEVAPAQSPASAAPIEEAGELDWLSNIPADTPNAASADITEMADMAEPGNAPDWLSSMAPAEMAPATEAALPIEEAGELDWLSSIPADTRSASPAAEMADTAEPGDAPDWLSSMAPADIAPAASAAPAADSGDMDWLSSVPADTPSAVPAAEITHTDMVEPGDASDWLSSMAPAAEIAEPADDSGLGWLSSMAPAESAVGDTPAQESGGLDWLNSTAPAEISPAAEIAEPAEAGGLDWLNSMAPADAAADSALPTAEISQDSDWFGSLSTAAPTDSAAPAQAEAGGLDWLGSVPDAQATPADASASDVHDVDWFGSLSAGDAAAVSAQPAPADSASLDWLAAPPAAESEQPVDQAAELFDLHSSGEEASDWMSSQPAVAEEETGIVSEGDPLAWLHPYKEPNAADETGGAEEPAVAEIGDEPLAQAETPAWLSSMAPAQTENAAAPATIDELDFGSLEPTGEAEATSDWMSTPAAQPDRGGDWLSSLGSTPQAAEPAAVAGLDWLSTPADQSAPAAQPAVELEDDWLASFEAPVAADTSMPAEPAASWQTPVAEPPQESAPADSWMSSFELPAADAQAAPADANEWLGSLASDQVRQSETPSASGGDWLGSLSVDQAMPDAQAQDEPAAVVDVPASAQDDWLASFGADTTAQVDLAASADAMPEIGDAELPEPEDRFDNMMNLATERVDQPKIFGETGILGAGAAPDWLSALGGDSAPAEPSPAAVDTAASPSWMSSAPSAPAEDTVSTRPDMSDASNMFADSSGEVVEGATPSWLADMAPAAAQSAPAMSLDDLDFGQLEADEPESSVASAEVPSWMSEMAPASEASATPSLDTLDFGSLDASAAQTEPASSAGQDDFDFDSFLNEPSFVAQSDPPRAEALPAAERPKADEPPGFDPFAEQDNLVNTKTSPETPTFNFDRPPAWMRKKPAPQPKPSEDLPDWLKGTGDSSSGSSKQNDVPDWLK